MISQSTVQLQCSLTRRSSPRHAGAQWPPARCWPVPLIHVPARLHDRAGPSGAHVWSKRSEASVVPPSGLRMPASPGGKPSATHEPHTHRRIFTLATIQASQLIYLSFNLGFVIGIATSFHAMTSYCIFSLRTTSTSSTLCRSSTGASGYRDCSPTNCSPLHCRTPLRNSRRCL